MTKTPDELKLRVWWGLLRAHQQSTRSLDTALLEQKGLSLSEYEVLIRLARVPDRAIRLSQLAEMVLMKPSGMSHLVNRLEKRGFLERRRPSDDARGYLAVLTDPGMDRLLEAIPVHLESLDQHLVGRLSEPQLKTLAQSLEQVLEDPERISPGSLASFLSGLLDAPVGRGTE